MFNKKRLIALLTGTLLVGSLAVGCSSSNAGSGSGNESNKITVSGSTSIGPTMEILAEDYQILPKSKLGAFYSEEDCIVW